jgi:hypothetical protein
MRPVIVGGSLCISFLLWCGKEVQAYGADERLIGAFPSAAEAAAAIDKAAKAAKAGGVAP